MPSPIGLGDSGSNIKKELLYALNSVSDGR